MQTLEQLEASIVETNRIVCSIECIFRDEFSDVSKAMLASTFSGLIALTRANEYSAAKMLIAGASQIPPGVTQERFDEVKQMLLSIFP